MEGFLLKMAFEISEGLYAGLSLIPTGELQSAVRDKEKFLSLLEVAQSNLSGSGVLDASGNATKNGMLSTIKSKIFFYLFNTIIFIIQVILKKFLKTKTILYNCWDFGSAPKLTRWMMLTL